MRHRRHGNNWIWFLLLFFFLGSGTVLPLLLIIGAVAAIAFAAVSASNKRDSSYEENYSRGYTRSRSYTRTSSTSSGTSSFSASETAKINVYLRRWFANSNVISVNERLQLRMHGTRYASLSSLDVYRDGTYICGMDEFRRRYPDSYEEILRILLNNAVNNDYSGQVYDAEVVEKPVEKEKPAEEKSEKKEPEKNAYTYIDEINALNSNIPDEDITNGLYETTLLLKQIGDIEQKFPNSKDKLKKLYEYYLPIMVRILKQYEALQSAKSDPSYEETQQRLKKTVNLINDAMKTIISGLTDQDFINLSADMSTLEAVLQKDGYTSAGQMAQTKEGGLRL